MAGFSTTSGGLNFQYPNRDTQNWDTVMSNTFNTLSSHDHSRDTAGRGTAITDRAILLANAGWLQATDFAGTGTINLIRVNTSNVIDLGVAVNALDNFDVAGNLNLGTNDTYLTGRNFADSANVNMLKLNTSNELSFAQNANFDGTIAGASNIQISTNNTWFQGRNVADSGYVNLFKVNASDDAELGADLDIKANSIKTTTTNGDVNLLPNGTGRVVLGSSGSQLPSGDVGTNGYMLMTNGTDDADWVSMGWETVDSYATVGGETEYVWDLSTYSTEYTEWAILARTVGGSVSSYPTVELRTAASGAIGTVFGRFDTAGFNVVSGTAIYGSSTNGSGTGKTAFVAVRHNQAPNGVEVMIEGYFINTAGNNMPIFGQGGAIVGELVFKNAAGTLASGGNIYLLGKRGV